MKLKIPSKVPFDADEADGKHRMTMEDWERLRRVMTKFDSFGQLEMRLERGKIEQRHALRHIDVLEFLDDERWPTGIKLKDVFTSVLNCFGDEMVKHNGVMPTGLPFEYLLAKGADDMCVSERTYKSQLNSLIKGRYLELSYGSVKFPAVKEGADSKA